MNNKILVVSLILASVLVLGSVFAVSATTVLNYNWNGAGYSTVTFDTGDAIMNFQTNGGLTNGSLYAKDYDDNPYGYGVDTFLTHVRADVDNGYIQYVVDRTDSKTSYGVAGQTSYSYISSSETASLDFRTRTEYAALKTINHGFQASNQFVASGNYYAEHSIITPTSFAGFQATGEGTLNLDYMSEEAAGNSIRFGWGCGCYTNANVDQTGAGFFGVTGDFENSFTNDGITAGGAVSYSESYTFTDGFSWTGYNFMGN